MHLRPTKNFDARTGTLILGALIVTIPSILPATAQEAEPVVGHIIVTAERRPVDIQAVPLSVSALTEQDLRLLPTSRAVI